MTTEGLRARKRRTTSEAIQRAALELALEGDDLQPTVDAIAARADVSPRTFFNYFATRDDALVGQPLDVPDGIDPMIGDTLFAMLEHVARDLLSAGDVDRELVLLRRRVMRGHPELFAKRMAQSREAEQQLVALAERRAALDGDPAAHERGRIAAFVAMGAIRAGWMRWVDRAGAESLDDSIAATFAEVRHMVHDGVEE